MLDYETDLAIDPSEIDKEVLLQPRLVGRYGKLLADARLLLKRAEEKKKTVRSALVLNARSDPALCGGKATDSSVEAYYRTHPDYTSCVEDLLQKEHTVDLLEVANRAIAHRKSMIELSVRLLLSDYFATPKAPKDIDSRAFQDKLDRMAERMAKEQGERRAASRRKAG